TQKNNDGQLWSIIEKQRIIILELQKALSEVTIERDHLLLANTATPIPPPRSPYRSNHNKKLSIQLKDQHDEQHMIPIRLKVKSIHADSFILSIVNKKNNQELWKIEKLYTDLLCLDMAVNINFAPIAILSLKNNKLDFLFSNTNSLDKTLLLIDEYLEDTIRLLKHDMSIMYSFFLDKKLKQGYLTKRNVACCKKYYFVLKGSELKYFIKNEDQLSMGIIDLVAETRIGKQATKKYGDAIFQHAFIILLEQENHAYKYILCAESDTERDEWVKQLHRQQCSTVPHHTRPNSDISMHPTEKKKNIRHKQYKRSSMDDKAIQTFNNSKLFNQLSTKASDDSIPTTIDSTEEKKKASRRTFWTRNKKLFNSEDDCIDPSLSSSSTIATPAYQVFGVSLEESIRLTRISEKFDLPAIVYRCITYLEAKDAIHEEGIYRQNGSSLQINQLRQRFCEYGDLDLLAMPQTDQHLDVNVVAGLLKMWLRELPVNILTFDLLKDFLKVIDEKNKQVRIKKLGHLVSMLPIANYSLLRTLIAHLIHIVHYSDHNKMTLRNIGIVFAPTLSIPSGIFTLFMSEFEYIFWTDKATTVSSLPTFKKPVYPIIMEPSTSADKIKQQYLKAEEVRSSRNSVSFKNNVPLSIMSLETVINKVKYHHMDMLAEYDDPEQ
ncbi:hypothetical protein INT47_001042, partial [Mucor saturninus]